MNDFVPKNRGKKKVMPKVGNVAELVQMLVKLCDKQDIDALTAFTVPVFIRDEHGDFDVGIELTKDGEVVLSPRGYYRRGDTKDGESSQGK